MCLLQSPSGRFDSDYLHVFKPGAVAAQTAIGPWITTQGYGPRAMIETPYIAFQRWKIQLGGRVSDERKGPTYEHPAV